MNAALVLAVDDSQVTPGVLGFLVVAALGVATWLLLRSMRRQMRKIDFEEPPVGGRDEVQPGAAEATADAAPPSGEEPDGSVR